MYNHWISSRAYGVGRMPSTLQRCDAYVTINLVCLGFSLDVRVASSASRRPTVVVLNSSCLPSSVVVVRASASGATAACAASALCRSSSASVCAGSGLDRWPRCARWACTLRSGGSSATCRWRRRGRRHGCGRACVACSRARRDSDTSGFPGCSVRTSGGWNIWSCCTRRASAWRLQITNAVLQHGYIGPIEADHYLSTRQ